MQAMQFLAIGLVAGIFSGVFGVGGGLIIVPALVFLIGFPLHLAIGTSLGALLLPVGLFGAMEYYRVGNLNIRAGLFIALGLFISTYIGAKLVQTMPPIVLRRIYGVFLFIVAIRMMSGK